MSEAEKVDFLNELQNDPEKKAQFEFTRDLKKALTSREEKRRRILQMQEQYEKAQNPHWEQSEEEDDGLEAERIRLHRKFTRRLIRWTSAAAAVLILGFIATQPFLYDSSPDLFYRTSKTIFQPRARRTRIW
jgi:hypothetical protein